MVGTQDRTVSGEVIKVVHNDSNEQVEHEKAAEEDECDKEEVGDVAAAGLARLQQFPRGAVLLDGPGITFLPGSACQHDVGPGFTRGTSEEKKQVLLLVIDVGGGGGLYLSVHHSAGPRCCGWLCL